MNSQGSNIHGAITRDTMCVIEKHEGSLRTVYYPILFDAHIMNSLDELSEEMKSQGNKLAAELLDAIKQAGIKLDGNHGRYNNYMPNDEPNVGDVVRQFKSAVQVVVRRLAENESEAPTFSGSMHSGWSYGIRCLVGHADVIRGFTASRDEIEACRCKLEDSDYKKLKNSFNTATSMQTFLQSALDRYEMMFSDYIKKAEQIYPGLLNARCYCQNFKAAYDDAALDYIMTPSNKCVIERICEYYRACVLEHLYNIYETNENVIAYSHRKRGFFEYTIEIDPECDLYLLHETNFGFGRSAYLRSTLSYRGVCAIDVTYLIFFHNAGKVSFSNCTFDYDVDEKSFATSFDQAVRLHSEYRALGEASFVDRHFRKSLKDLSELLLIIANTDTFLEITTLERLNSLTSSSRNVLLPDEGFKDIDFCLSTSEKKDADELAAAIAGDMFENKFEDRDRVTRLARSLLFNCAENVPRNSDPKSYEIQLIVKKDLLRNRVINGVIDRLPNKDDITASARVNGIVGRLLPSDKGIFTKKYDGYDLIKMRTEKALSAIGSIARLRKIAELTSSESVIEAIAATCHHISYQAKEYISTEVEPNFIQTKSERDKAASQLEEVNKQIEMLEREKGSTSWLEEQRQELEKQLANLNSKVARLSNQRDSLQKYIRAEQSIQDA